jgi:hypothetical protein
MLYFLIYVLVCIVGHYVMWLMMLCLRPLVGLDVKGYGPLHFGITALLGVTERAVALTLLIWAPRYLAAFIGGWVLLKFAVGWQRAAYDEKGMVGIGSQLALIGNVVSFAIAIAGGLYLNPSAMTYFSSLVG